MGPRTVHFNKSQETVQVGWATLKTLGALVHWLKPPLPTLQTVGEWVSSTKQGFGKEEGR